MSTDNVDNENDNVLSSAADWRRSSQVFRHVASRGGDVTKSDNDETGIGIFSESGDKCIGSMVGTSH